MTKTEGKQEELIAENKRYVETIAKLYLNRGLISQLLAMGDSVEVLEPLELRGEIKEKINNMVNFYK